MAVFLNSGGKVKTIYVGNLPFSASEDDIRGLFAQYGEVSSVKMVIDRESGRSRGFGFVDMSNNDEADQAIQALNDTEFGGRSLRVNEARPREDRDSRRGGGGREPRRYS